MKATMTIAAVAMLWSASAHSEEALTGKWQGQTRSGSRIVLDLAAKDTVLTGTINVDGQTTTISDGKISKDRFTFFAQEPMTGELSGDRITIWLDRQGRPSAAVLTRVTPTALSGRWQGKTPAGADISLELTVSGAALSGTLTRNGQSTPIGDGRVSEHTFNFKATLEDRTEAFTGEFAGDRITMWMDRLGRDKAAVLQRVRR